MKNYDETHVDFKNHTNQIPRKIKILIFFNLNNPFTDINMINKLEMEKQCRKYMYIYTFGKDIYFFSTNKQKKKDN